MDSTTRSTVISTSAAYDDLGEGRAEIDAVAYITGKGRTYYGLGEVPELVPTRLRFEWRPEELRYTSVQGVEAVHRPYGDRALPFGDGKLYVFRYCRNTDPGTSAQPVNRLSVLGLDRRGQLGFFRELDYVDYLLGQGAAGGQEGLCDDAGDDLPDRRLLGVELLASSAGDYRHELVLEAGSPAALF